MNKDGIDDRALDALLHCPLQALPDDGFTAAVMQRVRALPPGLSPEQLIGRLQRRRAGEQREQRCTRYGSAVGVAAALALLVAGGAAPPVAAAAPGALALALALGGLAVAWSLLLGAD